MRLKEAETFMEAEGIHAGRCAASWVDIDESNAQQILDAIEDCTLSEHYRYPCLSGEYADDPTPHTLREDMHHVIGVWVDDEELDNLLTVWEEAASTAFETVLSERAHYYLS